MESFTQGQKLFAQRRLIFVSRTTPLKLELLRCSFPENKERKERREGGRTKGSAL